MELKVNMKWPVRESQTLYTLRKVKKQMYAEAIDLMVRILKISHLMAFNFLTDGDMKKEQEKNIYF